MCGRYYRFATVDDIAAIFGAEVNTNQVVPPTFNASPDTWHPIIRMGREGRREIVLMRWGFIQKGAKDDVPAPSNAKSEGILTKWPFMRAIRTQRCIVPINGFYEWTQKLEDGTKQPYAIGMKDGSPFGVAGIWDEWMETPIAISRRINSAIRRINKERKKQGLPPIGGPRKDELEGTLFAELAPPPQTPEPEVSHPNLDPTPRKLLTYAVITCDPNELVATIHDRMPVILAGKDYERWLDHEETERPPIDLLRPFPAEHMRMWKVSRNVNHTKNNRPDLIDPIK